MRSPDAKRCLCAALCAVLLTAHAPREVRAAGAVSISIDAAQGRHPVSPLIYGMAFLGGDARTYAADARIPLVRYGGNAASRYNWEDGNATSAARDWGFRNRQADGIVNAPGPSSSVDGFIARNQSIGAASMITVPMLGWVAKNNDNNTASSGVPAVGGVPTTGDAIAGYSPAANQQATSIRSVARKGAPFVANPDRTDGVVYQDEWVHHLVGAFGQAAAGGVSHYLFDNEYDLWHSTHTDVHPQGASAAELLSKFTEFATLVKSQDPTAQTYAPGGWGWQSTQLSGLDSVNGGAEKAARGGQPLYAYFLDQVRAHDAAAGARSLDYLDLHYYPQASGLLFPGNTDPATSALRLRQTRTLWDASYRDESWQDSANGGQPIALIPGLKAMIAAHYPGTKLSITEWNYGAEGNINGGLAVADVLGIFGREGLDAATYWTNPPAGSPAYLAFKLYRNADGQGRGFGDTSVSANSSAAGTVDSFAALDSKTGALTVVLINKDPANAAAANLSFAGFTAGGAASTYSVSAAAPGSIAAGSASASATGLSLTVGPSSMTLVVVPAGAGAPPPPGPTPVPAAPTGLAAGASAAAVALSWTASAGATSYQVLRQSPGGAVATIGTATSTSYTDSAVTPGATYTYQVVAANASGTSAPSGSATATVPAAPPPPPPAGFAALYDDALQAGWQDWSWAPRDLANASPVQAGARSIAVTFGAWQGLYFAHAGYSTAGQGYLDFQLNGGARAGAALSLLAEVAGVRQPAVAVAQYCAGGAIPAGAWTRCRVPLASLGAATGLLTGLILQEAAGLSLPVMYLDQVGFSSGAVTAPPPPPPPPSPLWIYRDGLSAGFTDTSWATHSLAATAPVQAGTRSISVAMGPWKALAFSKAGTSLAGRTVLDFWVHGGSSGTGASLGARAQTGGTWSAGVAIAPYCTGGGITAGSWSHCRVPLAKLAPAATTVDRIALQEWKGLTLPTLYVDELGLQ